MNKGVLMCLNIPRGIKEEQIYELFCIAGPIEDIYFGKSGKSIFIVYEFKEAVDTAKEILKDVKLYGRPIRMFDKDDIENMHSKQEEEGNLKRRYESDDGPPVKRRYEEHPRHHNNYQTRQFPESPHPREEFYKELHSLRTANNTNTDVFKQNNPYQTASKNTHHYRSDLIPKNQMNYRDGSASTNSGRDRDMFTNPYAEEYGGNDLHSMDNSYQNVCRQNDFSTGNPYENPPASRYHNTDRFQRYEDSHSRKYDKPYDRRDNQNNHRRHSPPKYEHSSRNRYRNYKQQNYSYKSRR